eukprot:scaffold1776_cov106-Cylindrotheca_fusiformis.AAC.10
MASRPFISPVFLEGAWVVLKFLDIGGSLGYPIPSFLRSFVCSWSEESVKYCSYVRATDIRN